jgi:hypothetical protein
MDSLIKPVYHLCKLHSLRRSEPIRFSIVAPLAYTRRSRSLVIALLLSLSGFSPVASAFEPCPSIQSGVLQFQSIKAVYSHCAIDGYNAGIYLYPTLYFDSGTNDVGITAPAAADLNPAPTGILKLGDFPDRGLENVGANYAGNCEEVTATEGFTAGQEGVTYCGWFANVATASRLLLKATLKNGAWENVTFAYDVPTTAGDATPVPTLPLFGLGILVSLLGLFGLRKLRQ